LPEASSEEEKMTDSDLRLGQLGQIGMTVTDLDRSVAFYRDVVGLKFLFRAPNLAFFDCAGIRLMLGLPEANGEVFHPILYFRVDDIQKAADELARRGVTFETKPTLVARMEKHDLWLAALRDPDRNVIELMSEVPRT
jgi:catechol 2,3-dioxygenase-like lactoylglutathione lyase family enzyme